MNYLPSKASFVILAAISFVMTGCMTGPYHGQVVKNKTTPVAFHGYLQTPNTAIKIQAKRTYATKWVTIATTTSSSNAYHWDGFKWYAYGVRVDIADSLWSQIADQAVVDVRATVNGVPLSTFEARFADCWEPYKPLEELWDECGHDRDFVTIVTNL